MVNLPIEYSDKQVSPFGGMRLMKRFLDQTQIKEYLTTWICPNLARIAGMIPLTLSPPFG